MEMAGDLTAIDVGRRRTGLMAEDDISDRYFAQHRSPPAGRRFRIVVAGNPDPIASRCHGADPLGIGLDVDNDCAIVDASGRASERIFAVGPMSQAAFWESIAVPDIRLQAASLARRLTEQAHVAARAT